VHTLRDTPHTQAVGINLKKNIMSLDIFNLISKQFDFSPLAREFKIIIPTTELRKITDLKFAIFSRPSLLLSSSVQEIACVEDLHLYVNGTDVTENLRKQLIKKINQLPKEEYKKGYLEGSNQFLDYINSYDTYNTEFKDDYEKAVSISSNGNLNDIFKKIGDRTFGRGGNLHPLNFIYKNIDIETLSLREIMSDSDIDFDKIINSSKNLSLYFSQGKSPTFNEFDPKAFFPSGTLEINLYIQSVNPLEKPLKDIFKRLTRLHKQIEEDRNNYLHPISNSTEAIQTDLNNGISKISSELDTISKNIEQIG
jgi:hypothetical protein